MRTNVVFHNPRVNNIFLNKPAVLDMEIAADRFLAPSEGGVGMKQGGDG